MAAKAFDLTNTCSMPTSTDSEVDEPDELAIGRSKVMTSKKIIMLFFIHLNDLSLIRLLLIKVCQVKKEPGAEINYILKFIECPSRDEHEYPFLKLT